MNVLAICGSPRKGNTEAMLRKILDGFSIKGHKPEIVLLREQKIELCGGCGLCNPKKGCHKKDDMQKLYGKIFNADVVVLGSPDYFNNVSALMKNFMDRMCPYWEDERLKGKKAITVAVGASAGDSLDKCLGALNEFCRICGMDVVSSIKAKAEKPNDAKENAKIMKECFEISEKNLVPAVNLYRISRGFCPLKGLF